MADSLSIPDQARNQVIAIADAIRRRIENKRNLTFVLVGRTGVGKSSTINSLLGKQVAKTGRYYPTTIEVEKHPHKQDGIDYIVIDTPGLCDALPEQGNDEHYLKLIKSNVEQVDSLWYVTQLDKTRLSGDERRGIKLISEALGSKVWRQGVIVFTFADKVNPDDYEEALYERTMIVREEIAKYTPEYAYEIPSVAVSNGKDTTPDGKKWLGELFTVVFTRFSDAGMIPFLVSLQDDLHPKQKSKGSDRASPRIGLEEEQREKVRDTLLEHILKGAGAGAATGATVGSAFGPIGAAVGGLLGGALGGFFGWLLR